MKIKTLLTLAVIMLLMSCGKTSTTKSVHTQGDAIDRMEQLYQDNKFLEALALCDSMLQNDAYRVDSLSAEKNDHRYIVIMRRRISMLGYLSRQAEAVKDMKTLSGFCNSKEDDEANSYSSITAQMNVKIGLVQIDMGKTDEGFAMIDKGINAMRNEKSQNAQMATVNFMHEKATALDEQNRDDEAIALSVEALERMKHYREIYAESFARKENMNIQDFCEFYEGNFYALLTYIYVNKAEDGDKAAADSVRYYFDKAMSVPHWSEGNNSNIMMLATYGFLGMQTEFERAYRQVEKEFAQDTLTTYYINVQRYAARMAVKQGDNVRAIALLQRAERLQALHNKNNDMKRVAEAANAYEVAEMERAQQEMEVSRLKWIIMAGCMAFVALAICIVLLYFLLRNRKTYQRYNAIIADHDTNEMIIRALKMDPNTPIDYLLTLTAETEPEELKRRFALINGMTLDEFRSRLVQDEVKEEAQDTSTETEMPESVSFLAELDKALLKDDRLFAEEISRKDIAHDMGMPMMHIQAHLKEFTGCTLTAYITQKRLEHAAHLLLTSDVKVEAICYSSGFNSVATFYRLFTKHYGCPPAEYRASHEGKMDS